MVFISLVMVLGGTVHLVAHQKSFQMNFWLATMLMRTYKQKLVITPPVMVLHSNLIFLTKLKLMASANTQLAKMEPIMTSSALSMRILLVKIRLLGVMKRKIFLLQLWLVRIPMHLFPEVGEVTEEVLVMEEVSMVPTDVMAAPDMDLAMEEADTTAVDTEALATVVMVAAMVVIVLVLGTAVMVVPDMDPVMDLGSMDPDMEVIQDGDGREHDYERFPK